MYLNILKKDLKRKRASRIGKEIIFKNVIYVS